MHIPCQNGLALFPDMPQYHNTAHKTEVAAVGGRGAAAGRSPNSSVNNVINTTAETDQTGVTKHRTGLTDRTGSNFYSIGIR